MPEAKPQVVTELPETKRSYFMADPATLLIVGIDFGGPGDPGYDPRINLPPQERLKKSIRLRGVIKPVLVRMDGERKVVVDGRQRVIHARMVNLETQAANPAAQASDLVRVPYLLVRGDEKSILAMQEVANAYAIVDPPLMQARKIQTALDKGMSEDEIAEAFDIEKVTIADRIKLLETAPEVQKDVEGGKLSTNAALELAKVPMAEQLNILQKARQEAIEQGRADGRLSTRTITGAVNDTRRNSGQSTTPQRKAPKEVVKDIAKIIAELEIGVAKSPNPMTKDNRSASAPEADAMFSAIRRIAKLVSPENKTYDAEVRALVKAMAEDQAELETEAKPAPKSKAAAK